MKLPPAILACLTLALTSTSRAADAEEIVRFSNGDQLPGSLKSLSAEALVWNSPLLDQPASFLLKNVMDLALPTRLPEEAAKAGEHEATVKLTNGDTICGQLASVTDDAVALNTWFAGPLTIQRVMVASIKIANRTATLYRGPTGLDGWIQSQDKPAWTYARGAFRSVAAGSIARKEVLPDQATITFDISWKGDAIALKVILFSNEPTLDATTSGYELSFQRGSIYLRNCKTQSFLGSANAQALMENDRVHVEVRASRKSGEVWLAINDRVIEVWHDNEIAKSRFGHDLHFVALTPAPLRVSEITVAEWDGVIDRHPEPRPGMLRQFGGPTTEEPPKPATPEPPAEGRMELANGDSIQGEVASIQDGRIAVKTPLGDVTIPVGRLRSITLKPVDLERAKRRNGDIRAWFTDGSAIVFRLDAVGDNTLTGSSQNFGSATFQTAAFNRLEFNIYDPELEEKRAPGDW